MKKVIFKKDKSLAIPPGQVVRSGYISVWDVILDCRERMAMGDIDAKYQECIQNAPNQAWPCPVGYWGENGRFHIVDGRHTFMALLALGYEQIYVAWMES